MILKFLLTFFCVTLICISCRKNTTAPIQDRNPFFGKLAKLAFENGAYDSLHYNAGGSIRELRFHTEPPGPPNDNTNVFSYDASGELARIADSHGGYYDFRYAGGQLTEVDHYVNGNKVDYNLYDYQNGKLSKVEEYYRSDVNVAGYELLGEWDFFYYADGNLKQRVSYSISQRTHVAVMGLSVEYVNYDNKFNPTDPIFNFPYESPIRMAKNNPGKIIIDDKLNGDITEYIFEYTYNDLSNPLTRKVSYTHAGQLQTEIVNYYYY